MLCVRSQGGGFALGHSLLCPGELEGLTLETQRVDSLSLTGQKRGFNAASKETAHVEVFFFVSHETGPNPGVERL